MLEAKVLSRVNYSLFYLTFVVTGDKVQSDFVQLLMNCSIVLNLCMFTISESECKHYMCNNFISFHIIPVLREEVHQILIFPVSNVKHHIQKFNS